MKYLLTTVLLIFVAVNLNAQSCCDGKTKKADTEMCTVDKQNEKGAKCCATKEKPSEVRKTVSADKSQVRAQGLAPENKQKSRSRVRSSVVK